MMSNEMLVVIAIVVVAVALVVGLWQLLRRRRTAALRDRFGPEYDHVLRSARTPADAERELQQRQARVEKFSIRPLSREDADRFGAAWRTVQAQFVDEPRSAVVEADRLIGEVMRSRGYPVDDPNRRLDDLSVDHAHVLNHYRAGREIVARHERGQATTEDLRQAMVHFRALFEELVVIERPKVSRRAS
jgi:FtsZ-interacting cell division protein ZipA